MPAIVRVEDLLRIPQLTTGALMYASQSGTPYSTTVSDIINAINNTGTFATLTQLTVSGQIIENQINSLSGYSNNTFATIINLQFTGQTLFNSIVNTNTNLQSTGQNLFNLITGLSGKLNQTGSNLQIQITNLNNSISILSGEAGVGSVNGLTGNIILTGQGNITINTNGQNINISGNGGGTLISNPSISFNTNINWSLGNVFFTNITGTIGKTFTFSNNSDGQTIVVSIAASGTGILNWPAQVKWSNGIVPIPTSGNTDIYTFIQINSNTYSSVVQNFSN